MYNSITLPSEIEDGYFKIFYSELLDILENNEEIKAPISIDVFCDGYGGEWNAVMSVINTIKAYQNKVNFMGIIQSNATSGHSMIWSSILNRTCSVFSEVGIHDAAVIAGEEPLHLMKLEKLMSQAKRKTNILAKIYSDACVMKKFNQRFWFQEIYSLNGDLMNLSYEDLKNRGMITYE